MYKPEFDLEKNIAWQYQIRLDAQKSESFDFDSVDLTVKNAVVKPVDYQTAKEIIVKYEWLGKMPAIVKYIYGIFFPTKDGDEICGGVVTFSTDYGENLGVWDKYGFTGKIILLSRGVCLWWTPKNTASRLIGEAIKQLPQEYEVVTATIDFMAGEYGTIYQACNFHYIGSMRDNNPNVKSRKGDRFGVIIDGNLRTARSIRAELGTQKKSVILEKYPQAIFVKQQSKHRYFYFRKNKKEHLKSIKDFIKPYPKRQDNNN